MSTNSSRIYDVNEVVKSLRGMLEFCKDRIPNVSEVKHKTDHDFLTDADLKMEELLIDEIKRRYPDANIISEETRASGDLNGNTFIIDPIDGTCNYVNSIPLYGIQIAYFQDDECTASAIYNAQNESIYWATLGGGAFCDGRRLEVKDIRHAEGVLILSDFYDDSFTSVSEQLRIVEKMRGSFLKIRLFGAACYDFTSLADNLSQAYFCQYRNIWDIAPGLLIASESGCCYCSFDGKDYQYGDKCLLVANSEDTLKILRGSIRSP